MKILFDLLAQRTFRKVSTGLLESRNDAGHKAQPLPSTVDHRVTLRAPISAAALWNKKTVDNW